MNTTIESRRRTRRAGTVLLLLVFLCAWCAGCTAVKPVVCSVSYPVLTIGERFAQPDDDSDDHNDLPPAVLIPVAVVVLPLDFAYLSARGVIGGVTSGVVSDLNVIVANADWGEMNIHRPFKTNAKRPEKD